jgi:hypothetical protein
MAACVGCVSNKSSDYKIYTAKIANHEFLAYFPDGVSGSLDSSDKIPLRKIVPSKHAVTITNISDLEIVLPNIASRNWRATYFDKAGNVLLEDSLFPTKKSEEFYDALPIVIDPGHSVTYVIPLPVIVSKKHGETFLVVGFEDKKSP